MPDPLFGVAVLRSGIAAHAAGAGQPCENQDIWNKPKALKRLRFSVPQFCARIRA
jgi:hypothetical protein